MIISGGDNAHEKQLRHMIGDDMFWYSVRISGSVCTPLEDILFDWTYTDICAVYSILKTDDING